MFIIHAFDKHGREVMNTGWVPAEKVEEVKADLERVLQERNFDHYSIFVQEIFD